MLFHRDNSEFRGENNNLSSLARSLQFILLGRQPLLKLLIIYNPNQDFAKCIYLTIGLSFEQETRKLS